MLCYINKNKRLRYYVQLESVSRCVSALFVCILCLCCIRKFLSVLFLHVHLAFSLFYFFCKAHALHLTVISSLSFCLSERSASCQDRGKVLAGGDVLSLPLFFLTPSLFWTHWLKVSPCGCFHVNNRAMHLPFGLFVFLFLFLKF